MGNTIRNLNEKRIFSEQRMVDSNRNVLKRNTAAAAVAPVSIMEIIKNDMIISCKRFLSGGVTKLLLPITHISTRDFHNNSETNWFTFVFAQHAVRVRLINSVFLFVGRPILIRFSQEFNHMEEVCRLILR